MKKIILLFLPFLWGVALAQDGNLDLSFNSTGKLLIPNPDNLLVSPSFYSIAQQADGKILAAGKNFIVRLNPDGSFDNTFDGDGKKVVTSNVKATSLWDINTIIPLSDGKILVCGTSTYSFTLNDAYSSFGVLKLNADGSYDPTFDADGVTKCTFGYQQNAIPFDMKVQADGKIIVAGYTEVGKYFAKDFAVARFNADGSLDNTFNSLGKLTFDSGGDDTFYALAIQTDGKIVMVGANNVNTTLSNSFIARIDSNGTLDTTFDSDGMKMVAADSNIDFLKDVKIQPDGKIVACGSAVISGIDGQMLLLRLNADGSLDNTFDEDGTAFYGYTAWNEYGYKLTLQSNGKIIAMGSLIPNSNTDFGIIRVNTNGSLDSTFDGDGKATVTFGTASDYEMAYGGCLQTDGKILAAGYFKNSSGSYYSIARLINSDGVSATNEIMKDKLHVYPNPCIDKLTVASTGNADWILTDTQGRVVMRSALNTGDNSLDVSRLIKGIYIGQIKNTETGKILTEKIIKR